MMNVIVIVTNYEVNKMVDVETKAELLQELKGLRMGINTVNKNLDFTIWKMLEMKKAVRHTTELTEESIEYADEQRVSYKKQMVKDAVEPFRVELEELSAHKQSFENELYLLKLDIQINRAEDELLNLL